MERGVKSLELVAAVIIKPEITCPQKVMEKHTGGNLWKLNCQISMKYVLIILISSLLNIGCADHHCPPDFEQRGVFPIEAERHNYCNLITSSLNKQPSDFQKLISIEFEGGLIINHGNDIVRLIEKIGTATICEWIENGEVDKNRLDYLLKAASIDHSEAITANAELNCD